MSVCVCLCTYMVTNIDFFFVFFVLINKIRSSNSFAPGDIAEKHLLKLVEWFSCHCRAIKS